MSRAREALLAKVYFDFDRSELRDDQGAMLILNFHGVRGTGAVQAALSGMSLSDYLLSEIRQVAERPTLEELRARLERRPAMTPSVAPAQAVRAERDRQ